jgi:hypothetical protein
MRKVFRPLPVGCTISDTWKSGRTRNASGVSNPAAEPFGALVRRPSTIAAVPPTPLIAMLSVTCVGANQNAIYRLARPLAAAGVVSNLCDTLGRKAPFLAIAIDSITILLWRSSLVACRLSSFGSIIIGTHPSITIVMSGSLSVELSRMPILKLTRPRLSSTSGSCGSNCKDSLQSDSARSSSPTIARAQQRLLKAVALCWPSVMSLVWSAIEACSFSAHHKPGARPKMAAAGLGACLIA